MICPNCKKEFNGKSCPYCGEEYKEIKEEKAKVKFTTILLKVGVAILVIFSFFVPLLLIPAIALTIVSVILGTKKEHKVFRNRLVFVDVLSIILLIISALSFINPYYDKWFSYKKIEDALQIDLPNASASEYEFNNGYKNNNIAYTYYKYKLTEEEYNKIINDNRLRLKEDSDWFIDIVSSKSDSYIIYDYLEKSFSKPLDELKYYYIFVQVEKSGEDYFAYIYKVEKRRY